jgi:hypothetical protein
MFTVVYDEGSVPILTAETTLRMQAIDECKVNVLHARLQCLLIPAVVLRRVWNWTTNT